MAIGELPRNLRDYRYYHKDETILVCGCGASLKQVVSPEKLITIGVNDVGRLFHPDYLVILNPRSQFAGDRFKYVENSQAGAIFTQLNLGISHPNIVRFRLGQRGGTELRDDDCLPYTRNSPYVALCLAVFMGARRIGLIGVDFTNDHFFGRTGVHPLSREFPQIDREYRQLYEACRRLDIEIFNLSEQSRLTALPKMPFQEFAALSRQAERLNLVSYSVTPVAGVPVILSQCIAARTAHNCRTVWASNTYGNGVSFPGDVEWGAASAKAEELLCSADLIIAHNGKIAPRHTKLLAGKPVITMAHNYIWNVDTSHVQQKLPGVVVGQYQATLPDFHGWQVVPNPVPLWDGNFQPGSKHPEITICYTPSGKHERYPADHRLYWHSKGYATTMRILDRLARRLPIRLETLNGQQVSHAKSMAMKQRSHIVIDECVTGSYHRNSLEGLAAGCVVVNALGHLPAVKDVFRYCSGSDQVPFVYATLESLEQVLEQLIERGIDELTAEGARNRAWMEKHWDFEKQWGRFWEPVVNQALQREPSGRKKPRLARVQPQRQRAATAEHPSHTQISVVVCQGGQERLRQLATCLVTLRQCQDIGEIIVVDMGSSPFAADLGRSWADKYVFVKNDGVFERARSLNIGTAFAEHDLVLWIDNDLIISPEFVSKAVAEMSKRQLDYLIPYTRIKYLSEFDTQQVMMGTRNPADCPPARVLNAPQAVSGGMGLVKKSFIQTCGGIPEVFRGWGGEDNAWWYKARLLGHAAATEQRDQQVQHLFHPNSGCFVRQKQSNPHYDRNLALLREVRAIRDQKKFLDRFPPSSRISLGWNGQSIGIIGRKRDQGPEFLPAVISQRLAELTSVEIHSHLINDGGPSFVDWISQTHLDAVVIFGSELASELLSNEACRELWPKTLFVHEGGPVPAEFTQQLRRAGAIICLQKDGDSELRAAGLAPWNRSGLAKTPPTALDMALALLQPLSVLMAGATLPVRGPIAPEFSMSAGRQAGHPPLPVWMYWEGPCPEWIKRCQQTVFACARDVRLLSPADFEKLWDSDRDIDLSRLHPAQRADFARAFLLARYGGLWLDSDCVVMQPLEAVLEALQDYDFIAHRERTLGAWANDFIGAVPGSRIAAAFYERVCRTLRSRKKIGWLDLGVEALNPTLKTTAASWLEIKVERIQPLCWSRYAPFLEIKAAAEHAQNLDRRAICYMMSNHTMQRELRLADLSERLLRPGTFFNYLLEQANTRSLSSSQQEDACAATLLPLSGLGVTQPMTQIFSQWASSIRKDGYESLGGAGSSLLHTAEIRQTLPLMLQDLGVNSVLDVACSDFNWMQHVRLGVKQYIGIDLLAEIIEQNQKKFGAPDRQFLALDAARHPLPKADLILCRDCLVLLSYEEILHVLRNFKKSGARYLLTTTFVDREANSDFATGGWRPLNLERPPFNFPAPLRIINEKCREAENAYSDKSLALWRIEDISLPESLNVNSADSKALLENAAAEHPAVPEKLPAVANKNLHISNGKGSNARAMVEAFVRRTTECSRARMESLSGPGSSLAQTAAIRRALPALLQEIGAKSILDAACGDFHWMCRVDLRIDEYVGIDFLPAVIEKNQKSFAGAGRKFLNLNIAEDRLSPADLILCRDCLVHFSYADIWRALRNFKASNSKYLLTTHFEKRPGNIDIVTGDWRPLNFRTAPFNFPEPLKIIHEKCTENGGKYADKSLALWSLQEISI